MPDHPPERQAGASARRRMVDAMPSNLGQHTRAEQLAAVLDARIRDGGLRPGESIGTLESLRAETKFAYSTISEAVRLLRDRGIIEIRPGRGGGLFVADAGPVVRMRRTLLRVPDHPETVADAVELREHLEILIATTAARHRTTRDVADLRALLVGMEQTRTWEDFVRANWVLHERIAEICPNEMARAVYVGTLGHLRSTSSPIGDQMTDEYRQQRLQIHCELVDAIEAGHETAVRDVVTRHNVTA
ncbi:GntR family transcriptional regulator [Mycolicibacterium goodii]|uniref:GntR family transcriptional regulator n=2 Tax=Mycolicibacterium goodii TaxID=134601 RepID=A0A0K0X2M8_MYCGD|nr:GntR family transcriptional regulator [Mycolicibacterium goodii]